MERDMFTWNDVVDAISGVTAWGIVITLLLKLLSIVSRYNVLLSGHAVEEPDLDPHRVPARGTAPCRYRLRIQSLEPTRTELGHPVEVTIRGFPDGTNTPSPEHHVWVAAGWKCIHVLSTFPARQPANTLDPYVWRAQFPELPGLDSWSFDVIMPCQRLELCIAFPGQEEPKLLTPSFGPCFEPRRLHVSATDLGEFRVRGPIALPRLVVPLILSFLVSLLYVLIRTFTLVRLDLRQLQPLDAVFLAIALVLIWAGYAKIRRPVYPVISGYRFITPPYPNDARGSESS
jgi:hypothetical protein